MRIPKYCVCISPLIPTTDLRPRPPPRPQADAVSDPLSVRESSTDGHLSSYSLSLNLGLHPIDSHARQSVRAAGAGINLPPASSSPFYIYNLQCTPPAVAAAVCPLSNLSERGWQPGTLQYN